MNADASPDQRTYAPIMWAIYLACSWTWCIGMFLPVLLVRDYGWLGFVVFAVPNVVGAAAMGLVLSHRTSREIVQRNLTACRVFSIVTCLFHAYFIGWVSSSAAYKPISAWGVFLLTLMGLALFIRSGSPESFWRQPSTWLGPVGAAIVLGVSLMLAAPMAMRLTPSTIDLANAAPSESRALFLAPVCALGFACCPYLDLTFHRAHQQSSNPARSFIVGFGLFFFLMIFVTLLYGGALWSAMATPEESPATILAIRDLAGVAIAGIMVHIGLQALFTTSIHFNEANRNKHAKNRFGFVLFLVIAAGIAVPLAAGTSTAELIYKLFMTAYGLVFPAYVWICMLPTSDGHSGIADDRGKRKLRITTIACVVASPFYALGWLVGYEWLLVPGVAVVLAGRLFVRRSAPSTLASPA